MSINFVVLLVPYVLAMMVSWHKKKELCTFSRPPWIHITALVVIFLYALTVSLFSGRALRLRDQNKVVPGWEPEKNLMVEAFIRADESSGLLNGSSVCSSPLLLLIVVCSSPANHHLRMAIRYSWASVKDQSFKVAFLFGQTHNTSLQDQILKENEAYKDMIQENFIDSYNNLTIKSVMMLKWFSQNCKKTKFLFKSDDDMFLDPLVLKKSLSGPFPSGITAENLLGGSLIQGAIPIKDSSDKWFMPSYLYAAKIYPSYLSGTGYLMSQNVAKKLLKASLKVKMIHMEDIYVTGLCAQKAGIKPIMLFGFTYRKEKPFTCRSSYFMSHRLTPDEISKTWKRYSACSETYVKSIFQSNKWFGKK